MGVASTREQSDRVIVNYDCVPRRHHGTKPARDVSEVLHMIDHLVQVAAPRARRPPVRIALLAMPFYGAERPSIQLGLLKAIAEREGAVCETFHFNLDLAHAIGPEAYRWLSLHRGRITGEWLFSVAAFGDLIDLDDQPYFDAFPEEIAEIGVVLAGGPAQLSELRHRILPAYIDRCADSVDWSGYDVVGFTSTFQQNVTFTAHVANASHTPTGSVAFYNGSILLGSISLTGDSAQLSTANLTAGSHTMKAVISGDLSGRTFSGAQERTRSPSKARGSSPAACRRRPGARRGA